MRFGQVQQLLDARAEAHAEELAAAERDQRMRELVALAERIGPRVEERGEPLQPVRRRDEDRAERDRQQRREPEEQPPVETAEEQDAERDRDDDDERAEVRFQQQQPADATITANSGRSRA